MAQNGFKVKSGSLNLSPLASPPASPVLGDLYVNLAGELNIYDGVSWTPVSGGGGGGAAQDGGLLALLRPDVSGTAFTLTSPEYSSVSGLKLGNSPISLVSNSTTVNLSENRSGNYTAGQYVAGSVYVDLDTQTVEHYMDPEQYPTRQQALDNVSARGLRISKWSAQISAVTPNPVTYPYTVATDFTNNVFLFGRTIPAGGVTSTLVIDTTGNYNGFSVRNWEADSDNVYALIPSFFGQSLLIRDRLTGATVSTGSGSGTIFLERTSQTYVDVDFFGNWTRYDFSSSFIASGSGAPSFFSYGPTFFDPTSNSHIFFPSSAPWELRSITFPASGPATYTGTVLATLPGVPGGVDSSVTGAVLDSANDILYISGTVAGDNDPYFQISRTGSVISSLTYLGSTPEVPSPPEPSTSFQTTGVYSVIENNISLLSSFETFDDRLVLDLNAVSGFDLENGSVSPYPSLFVEGDYTHTDASKKYSRVEVLGNINSSALLEVTGPIICGGDITATDYVICGSMQCAGTLQVTANYNGSSIYFFDCSGPLTAGRARFYGGEVTEGMRVRILGDVLTTSNVTPSLSITNLPTNNTPCRMEIRGDVGAVALDASGDSAGTATGGLSGCSVFIHGSLIVSSYIFLQGRNSSDNAVAGGNGGWLLVYEDGWLGGNSIFAFGGNGSSTSNSGGSGGTVQIYGTARVPSINTSGGTSSGGSGGNGGRVQLGSFLSNISNGGITTNGGNSSSGTGGNAGLITCYGTCNGFISCVGGNGFTGGSTNTLTFYGDVNGSTFTVSGGTSNGGTSGGTSGVTIRGNLVMSGNISITGGNTLAASGTAGNAGALTINGSMTCRGSFTFRGGDRTVVDTLNGGLAFSVTVNGDVQVNTSFTMRGGNALGTTSGTGGYVGSLTVRGNMSARGSLIWKGGDGPVGGGFSGSGTDMIIDGSVNCYDLTVGIGRNTVSTSTAPSQSANGDILLLGGGSIGSWNWGHRLTTYTGAVTGSPVVLNGNFTIGLWNHDQARFTKNIHTNKGCTLFVMSVEGTAADHSYAEAGAAPATNKLPFDSMGGQAIIGGVATYSSTPTAEQATTWRAK